MDYFLANLTGNHHVPGSLKNKIVNYIREIRIAKGEDWQSYHFLFRSLVFVEHGILLSFNYADGCKQFNTFFNRGQFIAYNKSYNSPGKNNQFVIALPPTKLFFILDYHLNDLLQSPEMPVIYAQVLERAAIALKSSTRFKEYPPSQRCIEFFKCFPFATGLLTLAELADIIQLPQEYIRLYLPLQTKNLLGG